MEKAIYTIEASTEWGAGIGPNGTGKRAKVSGFYVVSPDGRKARAFKGANAEKQAAEWASHLNETLLGLAA